MKTRAGWFLVVMNVLVLGLCVSGVAGASRITESFNQGWTFALAEPGTTRIEDIDASSWRRVDLPHDWSIEHTVRADYPSGVSGGYVKTGLGWYSKTFSLKTSAQGKRIYIDFDGVYMNSEVWVNGQWVGGRPYGFSGFRCDLTKWVKLGPKERNRIVVKVDNTRQMCSRWYTGSGIYRNVRLVIADPVHVDHWGTFVTTPEISAASATVQVETTVRNMSIASRDIVVKSIVLGPDGKVVATDETKVSVPATDVIPLTQRVKVSTPSLWAADTPTLYTLKTQLLDGESLLDDYSTPFGIRSFRFDADKGFFINGKPAKLKGVCLHEDGGSVGVAVPEMVWQRRLELLKEMGCNAVRCSHNPFRSEFYDMCDRLGLYVVDESFDEWRVNKREATYYLYFDGWAERDLADMIRRGRNHPSIIMWSIGNEIRDTRDLRAAETTRWLVDICHREDSTRPATLGLNSIDGPNKYGVCDIIDVVGYNFGHDKDKYGRNRAAYPDRKNYGSETTHSRQTRGVYFTQTWRKNTEKQPNLTEKEIFDFNPDAYNSSYDNGFKEHHNRYSLVHMRDQDWLAGEFRWTGIDYLGEAGPFPSRFKNFGIIDMCGFPKDTFYLYQSVWADTPVLHILPHWNWPGMEGVAIPVWVYANGCDSIELFHNDKSLGAKPFDLNELYCSWDVPYEAGTLKAVATKDGREVGVREMRTAGAAASIDLQIDKKEIRANHSDVFHAEVRLLDKDGVFVPTAGDRVTFDVDGPGRIVGVDNGDPIDHDSFKANNRLAFHGMCLAIVQSNFEPGEIKITARAEGLRSATATVRVAAAERPSAAHTVRVPPNLTYAIPDHELTLWIPDGSGAGSVAPAAAPKTPKSEKIKAREARKALRENKTNEN